MYTSELTIIKCHKNMEGVEELDNGHVHELYSCPHGAVLKQHSR